MYLYYDRYGTLLEYINDEALRQYNYNYNKIYVYIENPSNIGQMLPGITKLEYWFSLPNGQSTNVKEAFASNTAFVNPVNYDYIAQQEIPYNRNRDVKFFQYGKKYDFFVLTIPTGQPVTGEGGAQVFDENVLSYNGTFAMSARAVFASSNMTLGRYCFTVESSVVLPAEKISISQFSYLLGIVESGGGDTTIAKKNIDNNFSAKQTIEISNNSAEYSTNAITVNDDKIFQFPSKSAGTYIFATTSDIKPNLNGTITIYIADWSASYTRTINLGTIFSGYTANANDVIIVTGGDSASSVLIGEYSIFATVNVEDNTITFTASSTPHTTVTYAISIVR